MTGFLKGFGLFFTGLTIGSLGVLSCGSIYLNLVLMNLTEQHFDLQPVTQDKTPETVMAWTAPPPPQMPMVAAQALPCPSSASTTAIETITMVAPGSMPCPTAAPGPLACPTSGIEMIQDQAPASQPTGVVAPTSGCPGCPGSTGCPHACPTTQSTTVLPNLVPQSFDLALPVTGGTQAKGNSAQFSFVIGLSNPLAKPATPSSCCEKGQPQSLEVVTLRALPCPEGTQCHPTGAPKCGHAIIATTDYHFDLPESNSAMCAEPSKEKAASCAQNELQATIEKLEKRIAELEKKQGSGWFGNK